MLSFESTGLYQTVIVDVLILVSTALFSRGLITAWKLGFFASHT